MDDFKKDFKESPLSESSVSHKLSLIQRQCSELLDAGDDFGGLSLEDSLPEKDNTNPYDRG